MKIIIHRGTHEIGGNCIEVKSLSGERIIIDLGLPLTFIPSELDTSKLNVMEALKAGLLPHIPGLYVDQNEQKPLGVILSHMHMDHSGLIRYIDNRIPIYAPAKAKVLYQTLAPVLGLEKIVETHFMDYTDKTRLEIGSFRLTPFFIDHSAFDSYALLVECDKKRMFYSGDFRGHGRKQKSFEEFLKNAPKNIDILLMEGTTIGSIEKPPYSESDVENDLKIVLNSNDKPVVVAYSPQNLDRHVSLIRASIAAKRKFYLDSYGALCHETYLGLGMKLPPLGQGKGEVGVLLGDEKWLETSEFAGFKDRLIKGIASNYKDAFSTPSLITYRTSLRKRLAKRSSELRGGTFVYSLWSGYLEKDQKLKSFIEESGMKYLHIHSSGHADIESLRDFCASLKPKKLVPIHTSNPELFQKMFPERDVLVLQDNDVYEV